MTTTQDKPVNNIGTATEFIPAVISENAEVVLEKRYLQKNEAGEIIETPVGMFRRVAKALGSPDF